MSRNPSAGFRRHPRVADQMTHGHLDLIEQSRAAERAGDAARALQLHLAVPAFRKKSRHTQVLSRLADLGDDLPEWVWARWIVYQATRCDDGGSQTGDMHRVALRYVLETFHDDQLADCHANGGDPIQVAARVASESWIFQQFAMHEARGLENFLDDFTTDRLAEHSGLARAWVGSRMGTYQVGASLPDGRLRIRDPLGSSWSEVLDLGARSSAGEQGWVLGRLVPSGIDDLLMFDSPPIAVPEHVAHDAARSTHPWAAVLDALDEGRLVEHHFMRQDYELTTDVQELDLLRFATAPTELERVTEQLRSGRDEIARAAFRVLRCVVECTVQQGDAAYVAAAVLNPAARADAQRQLVREGQHAVWSRWAGLVHEPARSLLIELAEASRAAG